MTEQLKQAIRALRCAKSGHCDHAMADEAIEALERALTTSQPAQAGEVDDGDVTGQPGPLPETGWDEVPAGAFRKPSPTVGMNLGQRIKHVGGRENAAGYVEFGSVAAVRALVRQYLRDLPTQPAAQATPEEADTIRAIQEGYGFGEAGQATPEPLTLGPLAKRNIYDAIRGAYDLGYNDARNARTAPGDSAPGYEGRSVEEDHGGALFNLLSRRLKTATPTQQAAGEPVVLPSFDECSAKKDSGANLNPLERFVLENDPADPEESAGFQVGLLQAIDFVVATRPAPGVPAKLPSAYATSTEDGTWRVLLAFDNKDDAEATRRFLHDHGVQPRTMRSTAPAVPEGFVLVQSPITEAMHQAACKVLTRAFGLDGLPQRMLDALASAQAKGGA